MRKNRLLAMALCLCLALGYLTVAAAAAPAEQIVPDQTVSFSVTQECFTAEYEFLPEEAGTYVFYDADGGLQESLVRVCLDTPDQPVAEGVGRAVFTAQAGQRYLLQVEGSPRDGEALQYEFRLGTPVAPEAITLSCTGSNTGYVGQEGRLELTFAPLNAYNSVSWSTTDPNVVSLSSDGAAYQLVGPGKASVVATTENGLTAQIDFTVKSVQTLEREVALDYTLERSEGKYRQSQQDFCFVPEADGYYALSVSYPQDLPMHHDLQMSTVSQGEQVFGQNVLRFYGEAGKACYIHVEFWGTYYQEVTYSFLVEPCVPAQGINLIPERTQGYSGDSVNVRLMWQPGNSLPEEVQWVSSEPGVVEVAAGSGDYGMLRLLAPGTALITVRTESGCAASFEMTVFAPPQPVDMVEGAGHPVTLLGGSSVEIRFTPEVTAYYRLDFSNPELSGRLYADSAYGSLYYLEAGCSYSGVVDNVSEETVTGELFILRTEALLPVRMDITKAPNTTTYLKDFVKDMWTYQLLAGLEMEVGWSDGSVTRWSFDEEGPYVGQEYLQWSLGESGNPGKMELWLSCGEAVAVQLLTVLDKTLTGMELAEPGALQVIQNSCGMDMGDGSWYYSPYLYKTRGVKLLFSDGSNLIVRPDELVYGYYVTCVDSQQVAPWTLGGAASVVYGYGDMSVTLEVQIVESPVERIELQSLPRDTFTLGDPQFFTGNPACYFSPADLSQMLEGLEFTVWYRDGSSRTVDCSQLQWEMVSGAAYPFLDGYPLGLFGPLMIDNEMITQPCEREGIIEYMGSSLRYTIHLVEAVEQPPEVLPTDPTEPSVTDPTTEPSEPSEPSTEPSVTDPTTEPTEPSVEPTVTEPTVEPSEPTQSPSQPSATEPVPQKQERLGGKTWIWVGVVGAALAAGGGVWYFLKKRKMK